MKLFFTAIVFSLSSTLMANPFDIKSQNCVKVEIKNQYSKIFSNFTLVDVSTLVFDENNFEYMIMVEDNETDKIVDRVFVTVNNSDYTNAVMQIDTLKEHPLNIKKCF